LGSLKRWAGVMEMDLQPPGRRARPRATRTPCPSLALDPGAAPARLFSAAKQKEWEIKEVRG